MMNLKVAMLDIVRLSANIGGTFLDISKHKKVQTNQLYELESFF